jgi:hypothetical protein
MFSVLLTKYQSGEVKKNEMGRIYSTYGARRGAYRALVGIPEGRRPLERPKRRWRIILRWIFERLDGGLDWIDLAQDRDRWRAAVNTVMNPRVAQNAGNFLSSSGRVSFSRRTLLHGVS